METANSAKWGCGERRLVKPSAGIVAVPLVVATNIRSVSPWVVDAPTGQIVRVSGRAAQPANTQQKRRSEGLIILVSELGGTGGLRRQAGTYGVKPLRRQQIAERYL